MKLVISLTNAMCELHERVRVTMTISTITANRFGTTLKSSLIILFVNASEVYLTFMRSHQITHYTNFPHLQNALGKG